MKSMTGFGLSKAQSSQGLIEVSLRSVNGRFLEFRFHLPRELFPFEGELKEIIRKSFDRGTLDVFVSRKLRLNASSSEPKVNVNLAKKYVNVYNRLARDLKLPLSLKIEDLVQRPDVVYSEGIQPPSVEEKKFLLSAMRRACELADQERLREGKGIQKDLLGLLKRLKNQVVELQNFREETHRKFSSKLESKLKSHPVRRAPSSGEGLELDSVRLSQEAFTYFEKSDINEELSRLKEHLNHYESWIYAEGPLGKKLDFYTQELLREMNTIGSKSNSSKLTQIVVEAKTLIERLREQVQNVE